MDYNVLPAAFRDDANGTDLPQPVQGNQELMVSNDSLEFGARLLEEGFKNILILGKLLNT